MENERDQMWKRNECLYSMKCQEIGKLPAGKGRWRFGEDARHLPTPHPHPQPGSKVTQNTLEGLAHTTGRTLEDPEAIP